MPSGVYLHKTSGYKLLRLSEEKIDNNIFTKELALKFQNLETLQGIK